MDELNREAAEAAVFPDLIDRQKAIDALIDALAWTWSGTWSEKAAIDAIKNLPSVDAIPVVRCKDCKWFDPTSPCGTIAPLVFECRLYGTFHFTEFFCGCGERKSEEDPSHPCADSVMMGGEQMNDINRQKVTDDVIRCENCGHRVAERPFEIYCNIMCKWVDEKDCCTMFEPGRGEMRKNGGGDDGNG